MPSYFLRVFINCDWADEDVEKLSAFFTQVHLNNMPTSAFVFDEVGGLGKSRHTVVSQPSIVSSCYNFVNHNHIGTMMII
jgi:hypothetical protein